MKSALFRLQLIGVVCFSKLELLLVLDSLCLFYRKVFMFEFLDSLGFFGHCTSCFRVSHHLGGCVVEDLIRVLAFNCPLLYGDCLFVEPKQIRLVVDNDSGGIEFFHIGAITKDWPGLWVPGVYVQYEPLFSDNLTGRGSIFYSDDWLVSAKSVATDKVVIVPVGFVLDWGVVDSGCVADLINCGFEPIREGIDGGYYFPVVARRG